MAGRWSPDSSGPRAGAALVAAGLALVACAATVEAKREDRLRSELDAHAFHEPLRVVWPAALRLLRERGHQLVGRDRAAVGAPPAGLLRRWTAGGFETSRHGDHGLVMETMEGASQTRYRLEGSDLEGKACRVVFTAIHRTGLSPAEERSRDLDLELELLRRLEPDEAARIDRAVRGETAR